MFYCTKCGSNHVIRSGTVTRDFKSVPVGGKPVTIRMKVQRLECKECGHVCQEHIHFADDKTGYTHRMKRYVADLCRICTLTAAAAMLGMSWNTVKEIVKTFLHRHYSKPDLSVLKHIGIDEFAAKKGHVYKTIVVNLETGQIVYVGEGKGADALDGFWKKLHKSGAHIESVASDLSAAYIPAVRQNIPDVVYVFDHFHLVKLINEALDKIRKRIVREERDKEKKAEKEMTKENGSEKDCRKSSVVKGSRYILLRNRTECERRANRFALPSRSEVDIVNRSDITKESDIARLNAALELNSDLSAAYYLKEEAKLLWMCDDKQQASSQLHDWLSKLTASGIPELSKLAQSISSYSHGILAYCDKPISTAMVEGINNKIKTLKRMAYSFRDNDYFNIRLLSLHDYKVA